MFLVAVEAGMCCLGLLWIVLGNGVLYLWNVFARVVEFLMMSMAFSMVMGCVE